PRVPLPLRLRLRSSGTREPKSKQRYPNPYLHNPWYRKSRLVTTIGRFINQDPIGFAGDASNQYRYVGNRSTVATDPLRLYEIDFHYYVVYYLLRARGWSAEEAKWPAMFSQYVDDHDFTEPILTLDFSKRTALHFPGSSLGVATVPDNKLSRTLLEIYFNEHEQDPKTDRSGSAMYLGLALHGYADSFAHEGFNGYNDPAINRRQGGRPPIGHADMPYEGHLPDIPKSNVNKAIQAARHIYDMTPEHGGRRYDWRHVECELRKAFSMPIPGWERSSRDPRPEAEQYPSLNSRVVYLYELIKRDFAPDPVIRYTVHEARDYEGAFERVANEYLRMYDWQATVIGF
ncbi:MAG: DUF6765 family protein, partial [Pirellulales bacterium]